ncbi:hypothetical protein ACS0TY_005953 [Phlomoides rotata]
MEPARYETTEDAMHDLFGSDHSFSDESMSDENELQDAFTSNIRLNAPNNPLSANDHHSSFDSQLHPLENGNNNLENESEHGLISGPMGYKYALMTCDKSRKSITHKTSKKVSCPARLTAIKQDDESWIVYKVVSEHNHEIDYRSRTCILSRVRIVMLRLIPHLLTAETAYQLTQYQVELRCGS